MLDGLDRILIVDAGSGIRQLGNRLMAEHPAGQSMHVDLFLTHTHIDHILGLPFFAPLYLRDSQINIYGPLTCEQDSLEDVIGGQLSYRYFPVRQAELAADIRYHSLAEGRFELGDGISLTTTYLNHPLSCLGFRFEHQGKIFCTLFDTEPFRNLFADQAAGADCDHAMVEEGERAAAEENRRIDEFVKGAHLLVHDAQYTQQEYESGKTGWGHTSLESAIATAQRCEVGRLALIHHDPMRSDRQLDELGERLITCGNAVNGRIFFCREGQELSI
jgi:ribonuclease BN (tRNA processing enzyme)